MAVTLDLWQVGPVCAGTAVKSPTPPAQSWDWSSFSWEAASLTHLMQEAHEVAEDGVVVFWEALQDQTAVGHAQAALHTCNGMKLLAGAAQSPGQPGRVALLSTLLHLPGSFLL